LATSFILAGGVFYLSWLELWPAAIALVLAVEFWNLRTAEVGFSKALIRRIPAILMGAALALIISVSVRLVAQLVLAGGYVIWRWWWTGRRGDEPSALPNLLLVQAVVLQALFLVAAEWRGPEGVPEWLILLLVWAGSYLAVFSVLSQRAERAAGVMAATWALVATEISWVLMRWLHVYTLAGGYLLVPLPVLILVGLAYCYGSIYASQRQGRLSRARLAEYLVIGLVLIAIVVFGTPWKGSL
jgi:hypothetical protein